MSFSSGSRRVLISLPTKIWGATRSAGSTRCSFAERSQDFDTSSTADSGQRSLRDCQDLFDLLGVRFGQAITLHSPLHADVSKQLLVAQAIALRSNAAASMLTVIGARHPDHSQWLMRGEVCAFGVVTSQFLRHPRGNDHLTTRPKLDIKPRRVPSHSLAVQPFLGRRSSSAVDMRRAQHFRSRACGYIMANSVTAHVRIRLGTCVFSGTLRR